MELTKESLVSREAFLLEAQREAGGQLQEAQVLVDRITGSLAEVRLLLRFLDEPAPVEPEKADLALVQPEPLVAEASEED